MCPGPQHPVTGPLPDGEGDGRIPFVLRVGLVGHWQPGEPAAVDATVGAAIDQVTQHLLGSEAASARILIVSMLGEWGELLVAAALADGLGAELEVVLPQREDEYRQGFSTPQARALFDRLRHQARVVRLPSAGQASEEGYEEAGRYIVDHCDMVIMLGDGRNRRGQPHLAPVLAWAEQEKVPWIRVRPAEGAERGLHRADSRRAEDIRQEADEFARYNARTVRDSDLRTNAEQAGLVPSGPSADEPQSFFRARSRLAGWVARPYARADYLATGLEGHFKRLSAAIFLLSAAAVAVITIQYVFINEEHRVVIGEAVLLLALLAVTLMTRRRRVLDRWITYRFLAERLRSIYFMALVRHVRHGDRTRQPRSPATLSHPASDWVWRALAEVLASRPDVRIGPSDARALADYLSEQWIQDQITYHRKRGRRQKAWDDGLARATWALFALTLVASVFHILGKQALPRTGLTMWEELTVSLSIFLPALGAALHGIRTQAQFHRQHERSNRMADQLEPLRSRMRCASTLADIRKVAADTEYLMLQENSEWFGVVGAQDVELITL